jgi:predicted TIM-barrel fold metal-dependent hydrolase
MYAVLTEARYRDYARMHPGFYNICIHKGLSTGAALTDAAGVPLNQSSVPLGLPDDIPNAARDWPQLNFLIYHSCIKSGFWMGSTKGTTSGGQPTPPGAYDDLLSGNLLNGVPNIHWTTQFLQTSAPYRNVFAELGTTFASCIITFPSIAAHLLGQMLKYFGEDRIVFGSDSVWYGGPQWQIEAMWRFQIPEVFPRMDANGQALPGGTRMGWGYPQLTETAKRKILGLNNARLYGIRNVNGRLTNLPEGCGPDDHPDEHAHDAYHPVPVNYEALIPISLKRTMEFDGYAMDDTLSKMRREYLAQGGLPSNLRHGWIRRG